MIIKCNGCHEISFRQEFHDYEMGGYNDDENFDYPVEVNIFPKLLIGHHEPDGLYNKIPHIVSKIYYQSLLAIKEDANILAGLGLRSTVEAVCNDKEVKGQNLEKRISTLFSLGMISKLDAQRLHAIRFMGNDAAHELKEPPTNELMVALKIVEHLLNTVYTLQNEASELETVVYDYESFKKLLNSCLQNLQIGHKATLRSLLGNHYRRVSETLSEFESSLVKEINSGAFSNLKLGETKQIGNPPKTLQFFHVSKKN